MRRNVNDLYFLGINDIINVDNFNQLLTFVSKEKQEQIKRFRFDIDKKLCLYSQLLVRTEICKTLNIRNGEFFFVKNEYGKPHLKNYPNFHFNLSHTRNAIAVAIFDKPVGVDVEKIRNADLKIAKRFFAESEFAYIVKSEIGTDKRFYDVWTKKEAYIKYVGKGLSIPLNSFDVLCTDISRQTQTFEKDGYIISVSSESQNQRFDIIELYEGTIETKAIELLGK